MFFSRLVLPQAPLKKNWPAPRAREHREGDGSDVLTGPLRSSKPSRMLLGPVFITMIIMITIILFLLLGSSVFWGSIFFSSRQFYLGFRIPRNRHLGGHLKRGVHPAQGRGGLSNGKAPRLEGKVLPHAVDGRNPFRTT